MFNNALFHAHRALCYKASQQKFIHKLWSADIWRSGVWFSLVNTSEECAVPFLSKEVGKYTQTTGCHNVNVMQALEEDPDLIDQ
jgi:hypothetical protein